MEDLEKWCTHAKSLQSCSTPCDPMDCSPPGSSVHGILQARILEWVAVSSSMGSSQPRDQIHVSYVSSLVGGFFTTSTTGKVEWPSKQWFSKYSPLGNSISITCRLGGNTRSQAPPQIHWVKKLWGWSPGTCILTTPSHPPSEQFWWLKAGYQWFKGLNISIIHSFIRHWLSAYYLPDTLRQQRGVRRDSFLKEFAALPSLALWRSLRREQNSKTLIQGMETTLYMYRAFSMDRRHTKIVFFSPRNDHLKIGTFLK